jgi:hypothetical protein
MDLGGGSVAGMDYAPIAFSDFFERWTGRTRDEFLAEVRAPHLVMPRVEIVAGVEGQATEKVDPERTIAHWDLQLLMPVVARGGERPERPDAPDALDEKATSRITLGRAAENDLVLGDSRISKTQAWFERTPAGEWVVGDAGSTNGTRVDASTVPCTRGVRIHSGSRIRIAESLDLMFMEPEALWGVIERVRAAQQTIDQRPA